ATSRALNSAESPTQLANRSANGSAGPISPRHGRLKCRRPAFLSRQRSKSCPRKRVPLSHGLHPHRLGPPRPPCLPPNERVCSLQFPWHLRSNSLQRKRISHFRGLHFLRLNPRRPHLSRKQKLRTLKFPYPLGLLTSQKLRRGVPPCPVQKRKPNCMTSYRR